MTIGRIVKRLAPHFLFKVLLRLFHMGSNSLDVIASARASKLIQKRISQLKKTERPIRFGFYVIKLSTFHMKSLFELMLHDENFDPFIVVIPDKRADPTFEDMICVYEELYSQYGASVHLGYENGSYHNYINVCDACTMMNPYKNVVNEQFSIEHFASRGVPVFFSQYTYYQDVVWSKEMYGSSTYKYIHKAFCANEAEYKCLIKYQSKAYVAEHVFVSGHPKTDSIYNTTNFNSRKTVLLAPHHSILPDDIVGFKIGNFLRYYGLFAELPKLFPGLDWILRPHPVLKLRLTQDAGWTQKDWEAYKISFESNTNARFEEDGYYCDSFAKSSALIQDCGSFLPEYFFTGKPQCYMLESPESEQAQFGPFGQRMLSKVYKAFNKEDIIDFINNVVINGIDPMKASRDEFAAQELMINYPNASKVILKEIKKDFAR